jgi:hypothetical protein
MGAFGNHIPINQVAQIAEIPVRHSLHFDNPSIQIVLIALTESTQSDLLQTDSVFRIFFHWAKTFLKMRSISDFATHIRNYCDTFFFRTAFHEG